MERAPPGSVIGEWRENWPLVAASCSFAAMSAVSMTTLGVMMAPIEQETGWTRTEITSGPALISVTGVLFSTIVGIAIDRLGFRRIGLLTVFLMFASTGLMSVVTGSLWTWLALWCVFGIAAAATPGVYQVPLVSTFHAARGLALTIAASGTAISSAVAPLIASYTADHYGWRTAYVVLALIWGSFALPLMYLFFRPQAARPNVGRQAGDDGQVANRVMPGSELSGATMRESFRSPAFYKMLFGGLCNSTVGTMMTLNLVPILTLGGMSRMAAAGAAGIMGGSILVGKALGAVIIDRVDAKLVAAAAPIGAMAMPILFLSRPGSFTAAATGIAIYGVMAGLKGATGSYLISRYLGARSFGTIAGTINAVSGIIVGFAPMAASYLYDTTRTYDLVLWLCFPALLLSAILYLSLGRAPEFPKRAAIA